MAVFEYQGLDPRGKNTRGIVDAEGPRAARIKLKRQGIFATQVTPAQRTEAADSGGRWVVWKRGIGVRDLAVLTRQLSTLIGAGLPLIAAITALLDQVDSERTRRILSQVREGVNEGQAFHEVLSAHGNSFPDIYRNMVRSGEASGTLPLVLSRLADFLEDSVAFRQKVQAALVYPILMGLVGTGILWFLLVSVVPRVTQIFEDMQRALPAPTRILLSLSSILREYGWLALPIAVLAAYALRRYGRTEKGRLVLHGLILRAPAFGRFTRIVAVSRFTKTLGTLLSGGVPLLVALDISKAVLGNAVLERAVENVRNEVREGRSLNEALRATKQFPSVVCQMVGVGEESGSLDDLLLKISDAFESQVGAAVATLTSLLEPLMILGMGLAVGFVVLAILLPIFEMSQLVG